MLCGVTLCVNGLLAFGLEQRLCLDFNQGLLVVEEWILCITMVGSMTGFGASRAWTGAIVEAVILSGISVGVWSGLMTLTWVRAIWLAFGCVLLWMMGLCEQACSCCLSFVLNLLPLLVR